MATLMSPFIMVSCVRESKITTYQGYFFRFTFFPVSNASTTRLPFLLRKPCATVALYSHTQGSASLNWCSSINHSAQTPLPATHPLNRNNKSKATGLAAKHQRWDETWKGQRQ
jgi:hypothetical protein